MVEKIGTIKNPLTIIAMFAGLVEISATAGLGFISAENQSTYIWFLICFPTLLLILFFWTLNFNHRVLYAPSDYQNDENFLRSLPRATPLEKTLKVEAEIAADKLEEVAEDDTATPDAPGSSEPSEDLYRKLVNRSGQATYMLAEELIFEKLSNEFASEIQREVKLGGGREWALFDGIVSEKGVTTIIEVKLVRHQIPTQILQKFFDRVAASIPLLPAEHALRVRVLFAIAYDPKTTSKDRLKRQLEVASKGRLTGQVEGAYSKRMFTVEPRFYAISELQREYDQKILGLA